MTPTDYGLADNTAKAYARGRRHFEVWCAAHDVDPLQAKPPDICAWLMDLANYPTPAGRRINVNSIVIYKSAVTRMYTDLDISAPTQHRSVRATMQGLRRTRGSPPRRVRALREFEIEAMLEECDAEGTPIAKRNAAIIALGFACALRRSELAALVCDDVEMSEDGQRMTVIIRQSKTDQAGRGQRIAVMDGGGISPIWRLWDWLEAAGIADGPLFQTMKRGGGRRGHRLHHSDVPRIVKRYAKLIGIDPKDIAGHSLRAGFVTSAAAHHARLDKIMAVTRHTNPSTVMAYIRDADAFADHAGSGFL